MKGLCRSDLSSTFRRSCLQPVPHRGREALSSTICTLYLSSTFRRSDLSSTFSISDLPSTFCRTDLSSTFRRSDLPSMFRRSCLQPVPHHRREAPAVPLGVPAGCRSHAAGGRNGSGPLLRPCVHLLFAHRGGRVRGPQGAPGSCPKGGYGLCA
jgi:hypothetical protein